MIIEDFGTLLIDKVNIIKCLNEEKLESQKNIESIKHLTLTIDNLKINTNKEIDKYKTINLGQRKEIFKNNQEKYRLDNLNFKQ